MVRAAAALCRVPRGPVHRVGGHPAPRGDGRGPGMEHAAVRAGGSRPGGQMRALLAHHHGRRPGYRLSDAVRPVRSSRAGDSQDPGGRGVSRVAALRVAYALLTLSVLFLYQATKAIVTKRLLLYSSTPVIPGLFHITLVTNRGALFGWFHELPDPYRSTLFTVVPILAILLMLVFQYRTTINDAVTQSGLALILGGALGNLVDRLRLGYVIDFLDVFIGDRHWPPSTVPNWCISLAVPLPVLVLLPRACVPQRA